MKVEKEREAWLFTHKEVVVNKLKISGDFGLPADVSIISQWQEKDYFEAKKVW